MKLPFSGKAIEGLLRKVPKDLAIILVIIILESSYSYSLVTSVKNEFLVLVLMLIPLIFSVGCTYCLVLHYRSKAEERKIKSIERILDISQGDPEDGRKEIFRKIEKAAEMKGDEDE